MNTSPPYSERFPTRHQQRRSSGGGGGGGRFCPGLAWSFTVCSAITGCMVTLISVANPDMQWGVLRGHIFVTAKAVAQQDWTQASSGARRVADAFQSGVVRQADWARLGNATAVRRALPSWVERLPLKGSLHWLDKRVRGGVDAMKAHKAVLAPELQPLVDIAVEGITTPLGRFAFLTGLLAYVVVLPIFLRSVWRKDNLDKVWDCLRDSVLVLLLVVVSALVIQWIITMAKNMDGMDSDVAMDSSSPNRGGGSSETGNAGVEGVGGSSGGGAEEVLEQGEEPQVFDALGDEDLRGLFGQEDHHAVVDKEETGGCEEETAY